MVRLVAATLERADLSEVVLTASDLDRVSAPGATFRGARFESVKARLADVSACDFTAARSQDTSFERATFRNSKFERFVGDGTSFEFADLGHAVFADSSLRGAILLGANLHGAHALRTDFGGADFSWAETAEFQTMLCSMEGVRHAPAWSVRYGPGGRRPPESAKLPLYRLPQGA
jgi:uncharacterized protein YjbI with pentapeptide repeats